MQGKHRHTFWAEVYETVLATYVALPTTLALINPRAGKFNVTAKGGLVSRSFFDWGISAPYTALVVLNFAAFGIGLMRLFFWNTHEVPTVLLNLVWTFYSFLILGAAIGVASEARQVRRTRKRAHRLAAEAALSAGGKVNGPFCPQPGRTNTSSSNAADVAKRQGPRRPLATLLTTSRFMR